MIKREINQVKLVFTWDDNKTEAMYTHLPEYLRDQINEYMNELEELRAQVGDDYIFVNEVQPHSN